MRLGKTQVDKKIFALQSNKTCLQSFESSSKFDNAFVGTCSSLAFFPHQAQNELHVSKTYCFLTWLSPTPAQGIVLCSLPRCPRRQWNRERRTIHRRDIHPPIGKGVALGMWQPSTALAPRQRHVSLTNGNGMGHLEMELWTLRKKVAPSAPRHEEEQGNQSCCSGDWFTTVGVAILLQWLA